MRRSYKRLDIEPFGAHLIETGDLDPIYIALARLRLDPVALERWCVAYWCWYHAGVASYLSEAGDYWGAMETAARNEDGSWPRGHERRHARGKAALDMIVGLRQRYGTSGSLVSYLRGARTLSEAIARATETAQFGPWIGFKIADMLDRVLGHPLSFDGATVFLFKEPAAAALLLARRRRGLADDAPLDDPDEAIREVADSLVDHFRHYLAPPSYDRPLGLAEVETILCKWKAHVNGHYPLYNDITEIRAGLRPWVARSPTAARFLKAMPEQEWIFS